MLLKEIKSIFHKELDDVYPEQEVDAFFYRLIEHYLKLDRFIWVMQPDLALSKQEEQPLFEALSDLKQEKPLQYITGTAYFMDLELKVNQHVLIPRPETEELVDWILSDYQDAVDDTLKILDIGTGSGCIAITLAKKLPMAKVYGMDVSEEALQIARANAKMNGVEVNFIKADILNYKSALGSESELEFEPELELESELELEFELELEHKFDIIVSNPPYVRELEKIEVKKNVKDFEPGLALFVPDEDALVFYRAIATYSDVRLSKNGKLYLEINQYLGKETKELLEAHNFLEIELRKDLFGNDRMLKGIKP